MDNAEILKEEKAAAPEAAPAVPAAEDKNQVQAAPEVNGEPAREVSAEQRAKRVNEAFYKLRSEKRELKARLAELEAKSTKQTAEPEAAQAEDGSRPYQDLVRDIADLKTLVANLAKGTAKRDEVSKYKDLERKADEMLMGDPTINGADEIAAVDAMVDQDLYKKRPDIAMKLAIESWKEQQGISARQIESTKAAKSGRPSSAPSAASMVSGSSKAEILAKINEIDPTKPGAKAELDRLVQALSNQK